MQKTFPFYFKCTVILLGLVILVYILFVLTDVLVPLAFAALLAILLNPVVRKLEQWKFPRIIAIISGILLAVIIIVAINYLLIQQVAGFADQLPVFKKKFAEILLKIQTEAKSVFGISTAKQTEYLNEAGEKIKPMIGTAAGGLMGVIAMIILLPIYTFLFLFYKKLLINFLYEIFAEENEKELAAVLTQTKAAIQSYTFGLLLEALVVAILNTTALLILGVDYAVLLGVLGALLNIIPYIGGLVAIALPVLIATVTKDGYTTQLLIIAAYAVIQFIDNQFLVPYIVASKVKINALISIVVVLLGNLLWGVPGMFLAIPFIGVLKIIFDRLPELKPWGKLLGDEIPTHVYKPKWRRKQNTTN
jgi:AI-2 transport protein TqsA